MKNSESETTYQRFERTNEYGQKEIIAMPVEPQITKLTTDEIEHIYTIYVAMLHHHGIGTSKTFRKIFDMAIERANDDQ